MNWDAISAIAEVVGVIAVVVSLLYLAIQVKAQNRESRIASTHEIYAAFREIAAPFRDPHLAELVVKSMNEGYENLSEAERVQIIGLIIPFLRVWEEAFYQRQDGRLDDAIWSSITAQYADTMAISTNQEIWRIRRHVFAEEFRNYVDELEIGEYKNK